LTPEDWRRVREILEQALEVAPERRSAFLKDACAENTGLRREVEALIAADQQAGAGFLAGRAAEASGVLAAPEEPVSLAGARIGRIRSSRRSDTAVWVPYYAQSGLTINIASRWPSKSYAAAWATTSAFTASGPSVRFSPISITPTSRASWMVARPMKDGPML
jgi:hypothetical protein